MGIVSFNRRGLWHPGDIIQVQARFFHGKHRGKTYWLGVDTGASQTTLRSEIASELDIDLESEGAYCTLQTFNSELPAHKAEINRILIASETLAGFNVYFTTVPEWVLAQGVDGFLGRDFLSHFLLQIDFKNCLLTLSKQA